MESDRPLPLRFVCAADGIRLDRFLVEHAAPLSRRRAMAIIAAGAVRVNGRPARKGAPLHAGDVVEVDPAAVAEPALTAEPALALPVLFEDAALIAVDKPAGCPAVARHGSDRGTVANFLLAHRPETGAASPNPLDAGLVHRLDTGTSGVLLAACSRAAWTALRRQFAEQTVEKRYLAWVEGRVSAAGERHEPIAHHPRSARRMVACADPQRAAAWHARPAHTRFRPLEVGRRATLLEVTIPTGVRHQIRVHLAAAGHPVWGDPLYGTQPAPRLLLHSARLAVRHPASDRWLAITSPVPADFAVD